MSTHSPLYRVAALTLAFLLVLTTTPVSATEVAPRANVVLGSIQSVGSVQLRGVRLSGEGTLFAGDVIRSHQDAYAQLTLAAGHKVELAANTTVTITEDEGVVQLAMRTGDLAFSSASAPLKISLAPYEFVAGESAAGDVALLGLETIGVRATKGSFLVRDTNTMKSFVLIEGQEKLIGRYNGVVADSISLIASNLPGPVPAPSFPSANPAPQAGTGLSSGAWVFILAAVGGAAAVAAFYGGRAGQADEGALDAANALLDAANASLTDANATISTLSGQIADLADDITGLDVQIAALGNTNTALSEQLIDVRNAARIEINAVTSQLRSVEIEFAAEQTRNAILAAPITPDFTVEEQVLFTAQVDTLLTDIRSNQVELATIQSDLADVRRQLEERGLSVDFPGFSGHLV